MLMPPIILVLECHNPNPVHITPSEGRGLRLTVTPNEGGCLAIARQSRVEGLKIQGGYSTYDISK